MTLSILVEDDTAVITRAPAPASLPAFRTALVEARGALLRWDAASDARYPDAEIDDPIEASTWLAQVYGERIAAAVRAEDEISLLLPDDAELVEETHRLAWLTWARDWWPAGVYTPALSAPILAAETALAAHVLEHLLDDEDAVERALEDATDAPVALAALHPAFHADAAVLLDAIAALADDYGVELSPALPSAQAEEWALAAGSRSRDEDGIEIGHGTAPVRWADVPAQTVAADSDAHWSLRHVDGVAHLHVSVAAVPGAHAELRARFGPEDLDIDVPLSGDGTSFTGSAQVAASVALLPLEERTLWVRDPVLAALPGPAESEEDRDLVRERAVARLDLPDASLAERVAGE